MEYEINFIAGKKLVNIKNLGGLNFAKANQYSIEARKLAHLNNCNKYLFDHTDTSFEFGTYRLHTDGAALENFGFKNSDRVAIILSSESDSHLLNNKVFNSAKWCKSKYFDIIKEAEKWLAKDNDDDSDEKVVK
ncbi:MAG TPA: hypothetical protein VKA26_00495 [Ignavibacteriaceae bacterium]|nr:hypothetical protein [Ignavibacteriaceae bacterium]